MTLPQIIHTIQLQKKLSFKQLNYFYMEQNQTPQELLTIFCCRCWDYEMDIKAQQQKIDTLSASYKNLSVKEKLDIIPQLINSSKIYPTLIFIAKELFDALSTEEKRCLTINQAFPSDMDDRLISRDEYLWRVKHNFPCAQKYGNYFRPISALDIMGFQANVEMIIDSGSPWIFLCS